jgi:hypothetical protein
VKAILSEELHDMKQALAAEEKQRKSIEHELDKLKKSAPESDKDFEVDYIMHSFITSYFYFHFILYYNPVRIRNRSGRKILVTDLQPLGT